MTTHDQSEPPVFKTHDGFEVYPMPMFVTIETADVNAVSQWYQQALGFGVMFKAPEIGGQPMLAHLRRRKYQDLLIRPARPARDVVEMDGMQLCFQAGEEIDALAARASAATTIGKARVNPPADMPWNTREVRITDPDGRVLVFSHPRFDPAASERMQNMFEAAKGEAR
jgi:uncharacterized glyoxalase superfamily protein PhnB